MVSSAVSANAERGFVRVEKVKPFTPEAQAEPLVPFVPGLSILAHGHLRQARSRPVQVGLATELLDQVEGDDKIGLGLIHDIDVLRPRAERDVGSGGGLAG